MSVNKTLVFAPGFGLIQCVHIPILSDDCLEETESFNVTLSADHMGVIFNNSETTVHIMEDEGECFGTFFFLQSLGLFTVRVHLIQLSR